jgi:RNA polymerase sigma-70 factor, ECF subfamily
MSRFWAPDEQGSIVDRTTFDRLVLEHLPACERFAVKLSGDALAAEEIVQEALLKATRGWHRFRGESRFKTWLFRIVINAWRDHRSVREVPGVVTEEPMDASAGPVGEAMGAELGEAVARAVSALPARQREVVVLIVYERMDAGEAAAVLGINAQNVRTNLHLGRERLREKLKAFLPETRSEPREA